MEAPSKSFGTCGFEQIVILAGESKSPKKSIRQAILWSAPLVAVLLILSTSSMISLAKPPDVNQITPVLQALDNAFQAFKLSHVLIPLITGALLVNIFANQSLSFTENSRLPMVAGWNHLLPPVFAQLHKKYRTPVVAIMVDFSVATAIMIFDSLGIVRDVSFQLLANQSSVFYAITYLAMFAIPLVGRREIRERASIKVRLGALSAGLVTLLFILLSVVPIVNAADPLRFTLKIVSTVLIANGIGFLILVIARRFRTRLKHDFA